MQAVVRLTLGMKAPLSQYRRRKDICSSDLGIACCRHPLREIPWQMMTTPTPRTALMKDQRIHTPHTEVLARGTLAWNALHTYVHNNPYVQTFHTHTTHCSELWHIIHITAAGQKSAGSTRATNAMAEHPGHMHNPCHVGLYRDRMLHLLGALPLAVLRISYRLSFRLAYVTCVQPWFHCRSCMFEWPMDVCLSNTTVAELDYDLCVRPLLAHDQECNRDTRSWDALIFGICAGSWTWEIAQFLVCSDHIEALPYWAVLRIGETAWTEHICPDQLMDWLALVFVEVDNDVLLELIAQEAALAFMDE